MAVAVHASARVRAVRVSGELLVLATRSVPLLIPSGRGRQREPWPSTQVRAYVRCEWVLNYWNVYGPLPLPIGQYLVSIWCQRIIQRP